jgi:predicted permease
MTDLRYALRTFSRSPGLTVAAVVCLALGIGANATIFGVVDTLLFRPPAHVKDPGQVVRLYFRTHAPPFATFTSSVRSYPLYTLIRDSARAFSEVAVFAGARPASLGRGPEARAAHVDLVSGSFFSLLGVTPALGRFFSANEDRLGGPQVVVLSYAFWKRAFGGDDAVLGRELRLGQNVYTVIGVAQEGFTGVNLEGVDLWAPVAVATPDVMGGSSWLNRGSFFLHIIGRLRAGATSAQATREATAAFRADAAQVPYWHLDPDDSALLGPVQQARGPEVSRDAKVSTWLAAVSAIVLLIACANVANLLLARAIQRQRDTAVRIAMGAGRARLARQLLSESVLLGLAGGVAALLVALWTGPLIGAFLVPSIATLAPLVDGRVLTFTGGVALLTGILVGVAPAVQAGGAGLTSALKAGAGEGRFQRSRLRSSLLAGQIALTVVLIVGAGLFAQSLRNVRSLDLGFDPERVILGTIDLRSAGYTTPEINALYLRMLERVQTLPGVEYAAATAGSPFGVSMGMSVSVPGRDSIPTLKTGAPFYQAVTPGYFAAMGTPVRGRGFTTADRGALVAIVNQTMARLLWPGENAIGKCIRLGSEKRCRDVVGVVTDARRYQVVEDASMLVYIPFFGNPWSTFGGEALTALVVRTHGRPEDMLASVRAAIQQTAANLPYANVTPLADLVAPSIRPWRLGTTMFGVFAGLALVLAAVGLYGVLSYTVAQRTQEIGIRVAMGAQRGDVLGLTVGQGVRIAALGAGIGAVAALAGGRVLSSLLYGVSPRDPLVLFGAAALLLVVAAVASYLPARRAAKVDPVVALRYE